jgi:cellulose synthase/poly-beta-1,6-N-acetylglucosamine synthase-like glycosyltransferase
VAVTSRVRDIVPMTFVLACLVFACLGSIVYSYVLYPVLLWIFSAGRSGSADTSDSQTQRSARDDATLPAVAIVIAAYNEAQFLQRRIDNILAQDYPHDRIRLYVGSDGSTDATNTILAQQHDPRVAPLIFAANRGKASVLNDLVAAATAGLAVSAGSCDSSVLVATIKTRCTGASNSFSSSGKHGLARC